MSTEFLFGKVEKVLETNCGNGYIKMVKMVNICYIHFTTIKFSDRFHQWMNLSSIGIFLGGKNFSY